jgi:hypothetical protein
MVREAIVRRLIQGSHQGMQTVVDGSTGTEVVSAYFAMCQQAIEVALKIGCTRESLRRLAILALYLLVADDEVKQ